MASKAKAKKVAKKPKAKKSAKVSRLPGVGHNAPGKINKPLQKIFGDYAKADDDKKAISKFQRDLRAKAKEEHGVDKGVFAHEVRLQKMAQDARAMFEQGHMDLKDSLGYQHVMPFLEGEDDQETNSAEAEQPDSDGDDEAYEAAGEAA